jgi:hypothetical protein
MPIKVNAAKTEIAFDKVNAAKTQSQFVKVNSGKVIVFTNALPSAAQTFLPIDSKGYKISGGNYTGDQLVQRQNLSYYGRNSTRREGAMQLFDAAAIQAFLADRPIVTQVEVRQTSQHTTSGTNNADLQWHTSSPLPVDQQGGWVTPIGPIKTMALPKSTSGIRVAGIYTGVDAQTIGDGFISGGWKGCSLWVIANTLDRWGWAAGWTNRSSGESGGVPTGYTATTSGNRIELIITAQG